MVILFNLMAKAAEINLQEITQAKLASINLLKIGYGNISIIKCHIIFKTVILSMKVLVELQSPAKENRKLIQQHLKEVKH